MPGSSNQVWPSALCAESTDFGELGLALGVQELEMGEGECVGAHGLCVCALGHVSVSSEGQDFQGAVA